MRQSDEFSGRVAATWLAVDEKGYFRRGSWLADAAQIFGSTGAVAARNAAANWFEFLAIDKLGKELGDGWTVLSHSMSSRLRGRDRDSDLKSRLPSRLKPAWSAYLAAQRTLEKELLHRLGTEGLRAFGARVGEVFEWIRPQDWPDLVLDRDRDNVVSGYGVTYRYVRVIDPAQQDDDIDSKLAPIAAWLNNYYSEHINPGRSRPKQSVAFEDCRAAIGATVRQMKAAMKFVKQRRARGERDR